MKLSETTFFVRVNKNFIQKLKVKPTQLFWFVIQAAKALDTDLWDSNVKNQQTSDFDCWRHSVAVEYKDHIEQYVVEAVPYPKGVLLLGIEGEDKTYPMPENGEYMELFFPDHFAEYMDKSEEQMLIERQAIEDGQNKFSV